MPRFVNEYLNYSVRTAREWYVPSKELEDAISRAIKAAELCKRNLMTPVEAVCMITDLLNR